MVNNICPSNLKEHFFTLETDNHHYNYRILKMKESLFIYIGEDQNEQFNEMAMSMPSQSAGEMLKTTIIGDMLVGESQEFARNFAKRLDKLVFVSCNVSADKDIRALLEKRITEEIKNVPEAFL